jgi:hypothetical protein
MASIKSNWRCNEPVRTYGMDLTMNLACSCESMR